MKKLLLGLIAISLIGCQENIDNINNDEQPTVVIEKVMSETAQYIEDFEYLSKLLYETYPYFGVIQRQNIDINKIIKSYRAQVSNIDNIDDFYLHMVNFINEFQGTGHISLIAKEDYNKFQLTYADPTSPYYEALISPASRKFYGDVLKTNTNAMESMKTSSNLTFFTFEDVKTAYIGIDSFDSIHLDNDHKELHNFYKTLKAYDYLIIDIRDNSGGTTDYAKKNIIEPLATQDYQYTQRILFNDNDYSRPFLEYRLYDSLDQITPLSDFNDQLYPNLEIDDINKLTHTLTVNETFLANGLGYQGKIYILVGPKVYSSSESFADFCKTSGFATLVGHATGGDGIGFDPIIVSLPNSGIALRYSMHYGINSTGQNSEEHGTIPDILLQENENAYEYIMKKIEAGS